MENEIEKQLNEAAALAIDNRKLSILSNLLKEKMVPEEKIRFYLAIAFQRDLIVTDKKVYLITEAAVNTSVVLEGARADMFISLSGTKYKFSIGNRDVAIENITVSDKEIAKLNTILKTDESIRIVKHYYEKEEVKTENIFLMVVLGSILGSLILSIFISILKFIISSR